MLFLEVRGKYDVHLDLLDWFEISLWIVVCCILVFGTIFFYKEYKKNDVKYFLMLSIVFILFIFARFFRSYLKYYVGQPIGRDPYPLDILILQILIGCFNSVAIFFLYYNLEKNEIQQTHYFFSLMSWVMLFFIILEATTRNIIAAVMLTIVFTIVALGFPFFYFYIAKKASGVVRIRALMIGIGMVLIGIAFGMDQPGTGNQIFSGVFATITTIIVPIFQIIGFILMIYGFKKTE